MHSTHNFDMEYNAMYYQIKKTNILNDAFNHQKACRVGMIIRPQRPL